MHRVENTYNWFLFVERRLERRYGHGKLDGDNPTTGYMYGHHVIRAFRYIESRA